MDGRGRSNNSGAPASAPSSLMPNYGYPGSETSSLGSAYSPRDRFWSTPSSATTPEPWGSGPYTPQLEPSSFSSPSHSSIGNQSYLAYGGHSQSNGGPHNNNNLGDLTFSGPSPPNQLQPISVSSSPSSYPPPSPRRQYTLSSNSSNVPSPHHMGSHPKQLHGNPQQSPTIINGNGINGNSNHSSGSSSGSPPNNNNSNRGGGSFQQLYLNGEPQQQQQHQPSNSNRSMQNGGHDTSMLMSSSKDGPNGSSSMLDGLTGHPNELPGYLQHHPRQSSLNSSRYPGETKASEGDSLMQQQQQQQQQQLQYQQHQYYQNYGGYHSPYYQETSSYQRPYDPYQPYRGGSLYPPPPPPSVPVGGGYQSDYNTSSSTTTNTSFSSATDPGIKAQDLLSDNGGGRKIDSSPRRDSLQHQNHGDSIKDSHDGGTGNYSENGGGGNSRSNSDGTSLMNLNSHNNNNNNPQHDSSPCSSQSPSSFDLHYQPQQMGLGYQPQQQQQQHQQSNNNSVPTNTHEKLKTPSSCDPGDESNKDVTGDTSFLSFGCPPSPGISPGGSPNDDQKIQMGKVQRKLSTSTSPKSSEGSGGVEHDPLNPGTEDIKPVITPVKEAPVKKKRKRNRPANKNNGVSGIEVGREGIKEKVESEFAKIKEEPKDSGLDHGKPGKISKNLSSRDLDDDDQSDDNRNGDDDDDDCGGASGIGGGKKDKKDVPMVECGCFPADEVHAEPGPFYTHLGAAHNLRELREVVETRTGFRGNQIRLEKVIYTGKEGKTSHGCPLAKWILRRGSFEEQLLFLVKHRKGHKCSTAWIVVCCVIWEGVPPHFADNLYDTLVYKLNRFGIPTTRRSDTNEQRSCACQGVDPDTCGAAYSFGCAWSMFFNGCKYARSRNVRKFRLTEEHEESELEEKVQHLATHLAPLYERVATESYTNQIDRENEGLECRLGYRPGRPFSGVTACLDYCSHAHKDAHNMMNGCTVTVSLTRNRTLGKGDDEQYHVLPLYKLDDTDEHGSKEGQKQKIKKGQLEILKKFPCKVRIRKVPLLPSRRRAKAKQSSSSSASSTKTEAAGGSSMGIPVASGGLSTPFPSSGTSTVSPLKPTSGPDYGSSDMPPAKREKLFDDRLTNGTTGATSSGDSYGDNRFQSSYSGLGPSGPSSHHILGSDPGGNGSPSSGQPLWNHFGSGGPSSSARGQSLSHHGSMSSQQPNSSGTPLSSYFDHSFSSGSSGLNSSGPFGHNKSNGSSSLNSLTELTNSTSSISRHGSSSNLTNLGASGSGGGGGGNGSSSSNLLSSPGSSGGNPGSASSSGYSSMSPILPSFRNTFMTEAESMSMASSISSPGPPSTSQPDSASSPRSLANKPNTGSISESSGATNSLYSASSSAASSKFNSFSVSSPTFNDHYSSYPGQSYHHSTAPGIYHPQPHNPCLPPSHMTSPGMGGVPPSFSSSMLGSSSYGGPSGSSFSHHPPDSHYAAMNSLSSWNPAGYSSNYGSAAAAAYCGYSQPMASAASLGGMNPSNFGHRMNPYSPYQNRIPQQHQMPNSWASSAINPFVPPNMNLNIHNVQHPPPPPPSCFVTPPKPKVIPEVNESFSDNEDCFKDPQMGGVAIALTHGSVILQCAKHEMHATTALKSPNRMYPSRICLIFYQHKSMNNRFHGWSEWEKKIEAKKLQEVKLINQGKMEASPRKMKQLIKEGYIQDNQ